MTNSWLVIDSGIRDAACHMAKDLQLLKELKDCRHPVLHFYDWAAPTITYGYFLDPALFLNMETVRDQKITLARRPTGGGITLHFTDFAFSLLIPATHAGYTINTLENYCYINQMVQNVIQAFSGKTSYLLTTEEPVENPSFQHFCMAQPVISDIMIDNRKVAGGAQRRSKHGFLHQGTISLAVPEISLLDALVKSNVHDEMINRSAVLISRGEEHLQNETRKLLKGFFLDELKKSSNE